MQPTRALSLVAGAAALAAVVAGCGSSGNTSASPGSSTPGAGSTPTSAGDQATVTDTVVPPPATTTESSPATSGPAACATTNLTVTLGAGDGAAGSVYYPMHFTNKGSAACTITGYPGVSAVAPGNGKQVGPAATRGAGTAARTVTLSPGSEATALLRFTDYANFDASQCKAAAVSGFRVYPPANKAAAYVRLPQQTRSCTGVVDLSVQPVVAGSTGQ